MQTVTCGQCGKTYDVGPELAGKRLRCKACGGVVTVPTGAGAIGAGAIGSGAVGSGPPPLPMAVTGVAPPGDSGEADFDAVSPLEVGADAAGPATVAPPVVPPTRSTVVLPGRRATVAPLAGTGGPARPARRFRFRFNGISLVAIIGGIALAAFGGKEVAVASNASDTPLPLTCAAVAAGGYKANAHVHMTDYHALQFVIKQFQQATPDEWTTVWVPVITPDLARSVNRNRGNKSQDQLLAGVSDKIRVIIKTHQVHTEADLNAYLRRTAVDGLVINRIESLTEKEKDLLHGKYVNMDVADCVILEEGRKPAAGKGFAALGGGVLLVLVGLAAMFRPAS